MKLSNQFEPIREWAEQKGIYTSGDVKTQTVKLFEEAGELCKSIMKNDREEFIDALGDMTVVLVSIAKLGNKMFPNEETITLEECINSAYKVIAKRTGRMENGTFIKD
jgi:NTP pyrophosphatase (non-canonical NTP hydrolase)